MFALLGLADVIAFLTLGAMLMLLFVGRTRHGGHILKPLEFDFGPMSFPLINIEARPVGALPRLIEFIFAREIRTTLEGNETTLTYRADGLWETEHSVIALSPDTTVHVKERQPHWYLTLTAVNAFLLIVYAGAGTLTARGAVTGVMIAAAGAVVCGLQRTIDLTIEGNRGTAVVMSFSLFTMGEKITSEDVRDLADFIRKLAMNAPRHEPHGQVPAA